MKHDRPQRLAISLAVCGAIALAVAFGPTTATGARAQSAPPPPPAPNSTTRLLTPSPTLAPLPSPVATASPTPSPEPKGRKKRGKASDAPTDAPANPEPSATPTSPAFATLDGTWEFQLQYIDRTEYSYLTIVQGAAGTIGGTWKVSGKTYPIEGTYDGRLIRVQVKEPTGNITMSGYVEGASDMVGTVDLTSGKGDPIAFTAEHRPGAKGSIFKKGA